jgi:tyrosyl-tRNA synthetase
MFGKLMSISDELMARYYPLLLGRSQAPEMHPMVAKKALASEIVDAYHPPGAGQRAMEEWERRFSQKRLDDSELPEFSMTAGERILIDLVVAAYSRIFGLTKSRGEVRRLIEHGSVQLRGKKIRDPQAEIALQSGDVLRLDKTRAIRIK